MASVQFILGRSGTGKSRWCIDTICKALADGGTEPLILLVPEQATYQAERAILSCPDIAGFSRLHVLSFNRLGFWLRSALSPAADISRTGKQMILHKLLLERADELTLYKSSIHRMGLAEKLCGLLDELQHSNCNAKQVTLLAETLATRPAQTLASQKWADIATIFAAYEAYFADPDSGFSNPDTELNATKDSAATADFLKGARLWVDGFSGFSVQERNLLVELLKVSREASITLCLDPATMDLDNFDEEALDPCSLFASTEQTYCQLLRFIQNGKLSLPEPLILDKPLRFSDAPALATLEANLVSDRLGKPVSADGAIQIAACGNIRAEMAWTAAQIRALVKDNAYRYRDIAVVVPDMDTYQHYIDSAFAQHALPYFMDRPRSMKTHPLLELMRSALQVVANNFQLSDMLSYLKSPLITLPAQQIDALENYCRAFDIQGAEWLRKAPWDFAGTDERSDYDETTLDMLRQKALEPLRIFRDALTSNKTIPAKHFVKTLWELLDALGVRERLDEWATEDKTDQRFGHRQLFAKLVELMDEVCKIFDRVELSAQAWESIFTDTVSSITVKLIPPSLDQVLVGSIERSRHPDIKAVFLIGAIQKQFPIPTMGEALLTERDYQSAVSLELANPYEQHLSQRPYLAYIALTRASKQVFLSYPLTDEKGSAIVPWSGIEQLTEMFTDITILYPVSAVETADAIQNIHQLAQWLCRRLGKDRNRQNSAEQIAAGVLERMETSDDERLKQTAAHVRQSLGYDNIADLDGELAEQTFKFPMTTSASGLGTFAKCPYQYFAKYTLGLKPRQTLKFEPMDVGTFYHDVLEATFKALKAGGKDWADLSTDKLIALCDAESDRVISENSLLVNFIRRRAHHRYIIQSAREVLHSFVPMLAQLSNASRFKQAEAELKFGFDDTFRLVLPLDSSRNIHLRGLIDRVDLADIEGKSTALVFDYKTSGKSVDFAGMLYGLDLQLPIYLLAVRNGNMTPAGAFFLPIDGGITSASPSEIDTIKATFNKAKGLFDGRFFEAIDAEAAASGGWSEFYNYYVNKEGDPYSHYKTSGALKPDDFATLLDHAEQCIKKLVTDLSGGCIAITPFRIGTNSPCSWCDYRPLCRFDWQINDYKILENIGKEEALEKMKE